MILVLLVLVLLFYSLSDYAKRQTSPEETPGLFFSIGS